MQLIISSICMNYFGNRYDKLNNFFFITVGKSDLINPSLKYAFIGDNVSIKCRSRRHTQWFFNEKTELPENAVITRGRISILKLHNISSQNNGVFKCYGKFGSNLHFVGDSVLRVHSEFSFVFL